MSDNNLMQITDNSPMSPEECAEYVSKQLTLSDGISKKLKAAKKAAADASSKARRARVKAMESAKNAEDMANDISSYINAGFGHKKEAIEILSQRTEDLADNNVSQAETMQQMGYALEGTVKVQKALNEANELVFRNQQQIANIMKSLYMLGTQSIVMSRTIVRQLEMKLEGASKEELDSFQMQEIQNVINQLKAGQDVMYKQEQMNEIVHDHDDRLIDAEAEISSFREKEEDRARRFAEAEDRDAMQDELIAAQAKKDEEHDRRFAEAEDRDAMQDELIKAQAQKDEEHDRRLAEAESRDATQNELIAAQAQKDEEHDRRLAEAESRDATQDELIKAQAKKDEEHDRHLAEAESRDTAQDELIAANELKIEEQEKEIGDLLSLCEEQGKNIEQCESEIELLKEQIKRLTEKKTEAIAISGTAIAVVAAIVAIIQFFI